MKKILLGVCVLFFSMGIVQASSHTLSFKEEDNSLYYNTDLLNKDAFIVHTDMIPGKAYQDELIIQNNSNRKYGLYIKAEEREQSELADELLDNIIMKIYIEDELIYSGKARGLDYNENNDNLQNAIYLGVYETGKTQVLKVETMLDKDYSNSENTEYTYIDWLFYASYQDEILPINPDTGDFKIKQIIRVSICSLIVLILLLLSYRINKKINSE